LKTPLEKEEEEEEGEIFNQKKIQKGMKSYFDLFLCNHA
jgi:hypothetical protein